MRRFHPSFLALAACAALLPRARPAAAQDVLVLSGGGARGLAHVGAVQVLDSLGHAPAAVVGTSMGAVVGALYAAGYGGFEIRRIVEGEDWTGMFAERPVTAGPERRPRLPLLRLELVGRADGPGAGLVPDWRINRTLVRLLFEPGARARGDFDRLPRRYRAVVARLADGEPVALASGDLALAVRASMAVPGAFAPVRWDGIVVADGGLGDYLPVAPARTLGDRVMAVDVTLPPVDSLPRGALDLAQHALQLFQLRSRAAAPPPDVLILPPLPPGTSAALFPADPAPLIELGRAATAEVLDTVSPRPTAPRAAGPLPERVAAVRIAGAPRGLTRLARALFEPLAGAALDPAAVLTATDRLYATRLVDGVWPSVEGVPGSEAVTLVVRVEPAPPAAASGALGYDHDLGVRTWGAASRTWAASLPVEGTVAVTWEDRERRGSAGVRLLPATALPLAVHGGLAGGQTDVAFAGPDGTRRFVRRVGGWMGVEAFWPGAEVHAALAAPVEQVEVENGPEGLAAGVLLRAGSLPRLATPVARGWSLLGEVRGGDVRYRRVAVEGAVAGGAGAWLGALTVATSWAGGAPPPDVRPALGRGRRIPGLEWDALPGKAVLAVGAEVARPLPWVGFLRLRAAAGTARLGSCPLRECGRAGLHAGFYLPTPLGPVSAGGALTDRGRVRFELGVGPAF